VGDDLLAGGDGDDVYFVDSASDDVVEEWNDDDVDTVYCSISYKLSQLVEVGGGTGADTLTGAAGADIFAFTSALASDVIADFISSTDKIRLSQAALRVGDGDSLVEGAVTVAGRMGSPVPRSWSSSPTTSSVPSRAPVLPRPSATPTRPMPSATPGCSSLTTAATPPSTCSKRRMPTRPSAPTS
jgi:hypothetical protein